MADKDIKVIIEAILQDKGFQAKVKGLQDSGTKTASIWKSVFAGMTVTNVVLKGIDLLKKGIVDTVNTLRNFEQTIANVASVSGESATQLAALAKEAGRQGLGFSATQAGEAMYYLASAGLRTTDMAEVLVPALRLAAASQMSVADATDIVVNQLKTFNADMAKASDFTDIMAKTVASSNTNMQQLGEALSYASAAAAPLGIEFKDLNVLIASMADQGIKGARAGVQLRQAFTRLLDPTAEAQKTLEKYGLTTEEIQKLLPEPIKLLARMKEAFGQEQDELVRAADATRIFGVRQANVTALMLKGEEHINKNVKALEEYGGAADKMAKTQLETLNGAIKQLNTNWENFILYLGGQSNKIFAQVIKWVSSFINVLTDNVFGIRIIINEFQKWIKIIGEVGKAFKAFTTLNISQWEYIQKETNAQIKGIITEHKIMHEKMRQDWLETRGFIDNKNKEITDDKKKSDKDIIDSEKNKSETIRTLTLEDHEKIKEIIQTETDKKKEAIQKEIEDIEMLLEKKGLSLEEEQALREEWREKKNELQELDHERINEIIETELEKKKEAIADEINEILNLLEQKNFTKEEEIRLNEELNEKKKELRNIDTEETKAALDEQLKAAQKYASMYRTILDATASYVDAVHERRYKQIEAQKNHEINSLKEQRDKNKLTEQEYQNRLVMLDEWADKETKRRQYQAAIGQKNLKIDQAKIALIQGAINAYTSVGGGALGLAAAAAVTAFGIGKIREMEATPIPEPVYEEGTEYVPETGSALIHQGERIIPAEINPRGISNEDLINAAIGNIGIPTVGNVVNDNRSFDESTNFSLAGAQIIYQGSPPMSKRQFEDMFVDLKDSLGGNV